MKQIKIKTMSKDYTMAGLAGFLTGICLIPTVWNIGFHNPTLLILLPLIGLIAIIFGVWLGKFLSRYLPIMLQLSKFAAIGFLNTAINFGILNLFSIATGITSGASTGSINIPGTIIAASNSYVWNKMWVFNKQNDTSGFFKDVPKFVVVTIIGLLVNSVIIISFTTYLHPIFGLSASRWLNIGKFFATIVGIIVDFVGYKFIVFKSKS